MNELEVKSCTRKLAKKENMSTEEALSVIQDYDAGIKAVKKAIGLEYIVSALPAGQQLQKIVKRNANIAGFSGLGTFLVAFVTGFTGMATGLLAPEAILLPVIAFAPGICGIIAATKLEANQNLLLHKIMSPIAYKRVQGEIVMEKALAELKQAEFEALEAKMLKRTEKALRVINDFMALEGEHMVYESVVTGGNGYTVTKIPVPELDQWGIIRQRIQVSA